MELGKHYGFGPDVVAKMTLAQQCEYMKGITRKQAKPGIVTHDSIGAALAYRQQRQAAING